MKRHWFHILSSLADTDRHGFDVMRDVLEQTDGELRLWPATLYGALEQLADEGLIAELADMDEHPAGQSERRRYYRITRKGRVALLDEVNRLEAITSTARARLAPRGAERR
jgi:DNA-binding PadR family transcriptional regulator